MTTFAKQNPESGGSLSTEQENYLAAQMNVVSRSFAVVVACLEQPLRAWFATAYLLCRVADNIEDCTEPTAWKADRTPLAFAGAPRAFKQIVFEDLLAELEAATQYMLDLPLEASDYRLASLLCLLPALQTNLLAAREASRLFTADHRYKISRTALGQCMLDARRMIVDNARIVAYSRELQGQIRHTLLDERKV